jgi:mannose-6-phosphate isomerase-like protein (cupin superfamily)
MKGFIADIEELTEGNTDFRRVLYTGKNMQLVLMAIKPGEEIGEEVHEDRDQFFRIEEGEGEIVIDGARTKLRTTSP